MKPNQLTGPKPRIEDGLGNLPSTVRYRLRCRMAGRCPNCGQPAAPNRIQCNRCRHHGSVHRRAAKILKLWVAGAPLRQIEKLAIGKVSHPYSGPFNPAGLILQCKCGRVSRVHRADECCICGEDLWPKWVAFTVRRRWIRASEAERLDGLIG